MKEAYDVYLREGYSCVRCLYFMQAFHSVAETASSKKERLWLTIKQPTYPLDGRSPLHHGYAATSTKQANISPLMITDALEARHIADTGIHGCIRCPKYAEARDNGGVMLDGHRYDAERYYNTVGGQGLMSYYTYDATNVRLQELSLTYSLPKKWLGDFQQCHYLLRGT